MNTRLRRIPKILPLLLLFFMLLSGCDTPADVRAEETIESFFPSLTEKQNQAMEQTEPTIVSLLDDRVRITLPTAGIVPDQNQLRMLSTLKYSNKKKDTVVLAWENEILYFTATELLVLDSGYREGQREPLTPFISGKYADGWAQGYYEMGNATLTGMDGYRISIDVRLYCLDPERIPHYKELTREILHTLTLGEAVLPQLDGEPIVWAGLKLTLPEGYTYWTVDEKTMKERHQAGGGIWSRDTRGVKQELVIYRLETEPIADDYIIFHFGNNLKLLNEQSECIETEDAILGKSMIWHAWHSKAPSHCVVKLKWGKTLRISVVADSEYQPEFMEIVRSLTVSE